jgi:CRP/FNR family transcriptional regulator, cyclic AMP receptor protein
MAMLSNLDLIRRVPLLAHLTPEQAQTLADSASKKRFKRGECIVEQGKSPHALFIILTGRARVVMTDGQGRQVILSTLKAGDHIGEVSLIDNDVHSANVSAELLTDVLMLGRKEFMRCLTENSSMAMAVMKALVKRLRSADRKISSLALTGVYGRVANALLETAEPDAQGVLMIRGKVSRQDIAKMVGASREMVSRVMRDFEEKGFIVTLPNGAVRVNERRSRPR